MAEGAVEVKEGQATLYFESQKGVFYNPPQIPNRDLSVLALRRFVEIRNAEVLAKRAKLLHQCLRFQVHLSVHLRRTLSHPAVQGR